MKFQRQSKILELIEREPLETQEELSTRLREHGFETTQATVSRDIKELRLIKVLTADGTYKYATAASELDPGMMTRVRNIFKESVTSIDCAQNIVVIKTLPGLGSAAGYAVDAMKSASIVGSIAGDDTVFIVMRDAEKALSFRDDAAKMLK